MEIDKIALIKVENGKVLSTRSRGKSIFYFPGGKREIGESDEQTLIREIHEELSVYIVPNSIEYIGTFKAQSDGMNEGVIVKMKCYKADYNGELKPNNEIEEMDWLSYADINRVSAVDKIIFDFLKIRGEMK